MKLCTKCGENKPYSEFPRTTVRQNKSGYHSWCKPCNYAFQASRRRQAREAKIAAGTFGRKPKPIPELWRCARCGETKPLNSDFFYRKKSSRIGFAYRCKSCALKDSNNYNRENRERINARNIAWAKNNPDKKLATVHARNARLRGNGQVDNIDPAELYVRDEGICGLCRWPVHINIFWPDPLSKSLDHIIPVSLGGAHTWDNVQLSHLGCNLAKQNKTMISF